MTRSIERTHVSAANDNRYSRSGGPRDRSLRVGDKERDSVGEILREGHLEGRLDSDEFQARLERCMAAKTYAELDELIADFPGTAEKRRRPRQIGSLPPWPLPLLLLPLALVAAFAFGGHFVWLAIPLFFFFVVRPLLWRPWGGAYARGLPGCAPRRTTRI
jgi:uncharacterized protein DUF1707